MDHHSWDEEYYREYKDVFDNIDNDQPSPLELQLQTSRIYAEIAAVEYRLKNFDEARVAQETAETSYQDAQSLFAVSPEAADVKERLERIACAIERNREELQL